MIPGSYSTVYKSLFFPALFYVDGVVVLFISTFLRRSGHPDLVFFCWFVGLFKILFIYFRDRE